MKPVWAKRKKNSVTSTKVDFFLIVLTFTHVVIGFHWMKKTNTYIKVHTLSSAVNTTWCLLSSILHVFSTTNHAWPLPWKQKEQISIASRQRCAKVSTGLSVSCVPFLGSFWVGIGRHSATGSKSHRNPGPRRGDVNWLQFVFAQRCTSVLLW